MPRVTFFSFHYQRDIWRINQIRNVHNIVGCAAAGFVDASLWETARSTSDTAVKKLIDEGLFGTSVTVVFIGSQTAGRKFISYEIDQSIARGNGILGVKIHNVKDKDGKTDYEGVTPAKITIGGYPVYTYTNGDDLARWIEAAAKKAGK